MFAPVVDFSLFFLALFFFFFLIYTVLIYAVSLTPFFFFFFLCVCVFVGECMSLGFADSVDFLAFFCDLGFRTRSLVLVASHRLCVCLSLFIFLFFFSSAPRV